MARRLDILPIIHDAADLGSAAESVRNRMGEAAWQERQSQIGAFWDAVKQWADTVDPQGLFIYQDGLPLDAPVDRVIADIAAKGSRNHILLSELAASGAVIIGTEDPALLVEELTLARAAADAVAAGRLPDPRHETKARSLLERRDRFIAARIGETLPQNSRGALLIGLLHSVERYLPTDIETSFPIGRPRGSRAAS